MNSNQKKSSKISGFFNNLFASPKTKPARIASRNKTGKRAAFFVFLAVLVLGFSVRTSIAAPTTYTDNQKIILRTTYQLSTDQIQSLQTKGITYDNFEKQVTALQTPGSLYTAASAATAVYNDSVSTGDTLANAVNNPTGLGEIGKAIGAGLMTAALSVVIAVLAVIAFFCKYLLMFAGWTLDATLNPALYNFTSNQMVVGGWIIVRDVCNLFFLLVLLFIAMCTILKIEKYHAKKTLLMLIIMALLINFSKPIAIFIFDGSQLLMNFFLSQITTVGGQNAPSTKIAADIAEFMYGSLKSQLEGSSTSPELAVYYLFIVVFLFMFAIALFVTAIFLVIRIVAVMILIIVSPLAFFAAIVPDFSKMSSSWWSALFKYSYYGPAAAFFLFLAVKFSLATGNVLPRLNVTGGNDVIQHIIIYLTVLVFLYASVIMSQQFGIFAANAIVGNANKFMKWAGGMTKTGGMWGWGSRSLGLTGGFSQAAQYYGLPTRWMTKAGRQKNQARMAARVASALGVKGAWFNTFQKRAKEENEGLDNDSVIAKAQAGDQYAALQAVMNGDGDDLGVFKTVLDIVEKHPEVRLHFRHLYRKSNQAQFAAEVQAYTEKPDSKLAISIREGIEKDARERGEQLTGEELGKQVQVGIAKSYADKELGRLQKDGLAKVDFNDFADNPNHVKEESHRKVFREALHQRLEGYAKVNPSDLADLMSSSKGVNQDFIIRNKDFGEILEKAKRTARGERSEKLDA